jgi:alginate O-acetyltransferase complex protein AlgI
MAFVSPVFLFVFLPACLCAALLAAGLDRALAMASGAGRTQPIGHRLQNLTLLVFSLAFYVYGSGSHLLVMLGVIAVGHAAGLLMERRPQHRRTILGVTVAVLIAVLAVFKYAGFLWEQTRALASVAAVSLPPMAPIILPVGISFFVFQAISYVVDVYRGDARPHRSPTIIALYIAFFPQLIAGPIVRYKSIEQELLRRSAPLVSVAGGAARFVYGLGKKVLVADSVAEIADASFGLAGGDLTTPAAAVGAFAYTLQIYFDFSAYSDMAIGLGHMFGFQFPENFNRPLTAISVTDFWRRWHMTLSSCFRDYVYVPLGGSRGSAAQTYRNLWTVFLLSGLWHGAAWTFVVWGAFHGALLTIERVLKADAPTRGLVWRRALTLVLVVVGFTVFRASSIGQAMDFYRHLVWWTDWSLPIELVEALSPRNVFFLLVGTASLFLPLSFVTGRFVEEHGGPVGHLVRFLVVVVVGIVSIAAIASSNFSPFIYFQF